jgi:hypothetical protein
MTDKPITENQRQRNTQPIVHPLLGSIAWNAQLDMWGTMVELQSGTTICLRIEPDEQPDDELFAMAYRFTEWLRHYEPTARVFVAEHLLESYNQGWNDAAPITAQQFAEAITLESVLLYGDQSGMFIYNDNDLFYGHAIMVLIKSDRSFSGANIGA